MLYLKQPEEFNNPTDIVGCFIECQGKILLLHRQDHKDHGDSFGPPGGKVDVTDTDLRSAIIREVFEETGIECDNRLEFITTFFVKYPNKDFLYHQFRIVFDAFPQVAIHHEEHKDFVWVTPEEALLMKLIPDEESCTEYVYGNK